MRWNRQGISAPRKSVALITAVAAAVATLTGVVGTLPSSQAVPEGAGEYDNSFGTFGVQTADLVPGPETVRAVATGAGNTVVVLTDDAATDQVYVHRFLSSGALDNSFSAHIDGLGSYDSLFGVDLAVDRDDNGVWVLMQGETGAFASDIVVAALNSDGSLDTTFQGPGGIPGFSIVSFSGQPTNYPNAFARDAFGNFIIVGAELVGSVNQQARMMVMDHLGVPHQATGNNGAPVTTPEPAQTPTFADSGAQSRYTDVAISDVFNVGATVVAAGWVSQSGDTGDVLINQYTQLTIPDPNFVTSQPEGRWNFNSPDGDVATSVDFNPNGGSIAVAVGFTDAERDNLGGVIGIDHGGVISPTWNNGDPSVQLANRYPMEVNFERNTNSLLTGGYLFDSETAFVLRLDELANPDSTYGGGSPPGFTNPLSLVGTSTFHMTEDFVGRAVLAWDDGNGVSSVGRYTTDIPPITTASKVLYSDVRAQDPDGVRTMYGTDSEGQLSVALGAPGPDEINTSPVASEGGKLFYELGDRNGVSPTKIMWADSADGGNVGVLSELITDPVTTISTRPTYSNNEAVVAFMNAPVADPANRCAMYLDLNTMSSMFVTGPCGIDDLAINPVVLDTIAWVKNGDVWISRRDVVNSPSDVVQLTGRGDVTKVAWGMDGTALVFQTHEGLPAFPLKDELHVIDWNGRGGAVYYAYQGNVPAPERIVSRQQAITSFAVAPDASNQSFIGPKALVYTTERFIFKTWAGTDPPNYIGHPVYEGTAPQVGAWVRNLSVYPLEGSRRASSRPLSRPRTSPFSPSRPPPSRPTATSRSPSC